MPKRVVIGMSGGVDSSVAAYLLKEQGYEVVGLFMRNWDSLLNNDIEGNPNDGPICPQEEDYNDAKKVADFLGIELHRIDFYQRVLGRRLYLFFGRTKKRKNSQSRFNV